MHDSYSYWFGLHWAHPYLKSNDSLCKKWLCSYQGKMNESLQMSRTIILLLLQEYPVCSMQAVCLKYHNYLLYFTKCAFLSTLHIIVYPTMQYAPLHRSFPFMNEPENISVWIYLPLDSLFDCNGMYFTQNWVMSSCDKNVAYCTVKCFSRFFFFLTVQYEIHYYCIKNVALKFWFNVSCTK